MGGPKQKPTPERYCEECEKKLERKRYPGGDLECLPNFIRRKFCDATCMGRAFDKRHSYDVGWMAAHHHARQIVPHGPCSRCAKPDALDVHHKDGNHLNNFPANLERICRSCHLRAHRTRSLCVICGQPQKGLGYCVKHYQRFKKYGDPLALKRNQHLHLMKEGETWEVRLCAVPGCEKKRHSRGYCSRHAQQHRRGKLGGSQLSSAAD